MQGLCINLLVPDKTMFDAFVQDIAEEDALMEQVRSDENDAKLLLAVGGGQTGSILQKRPLSALDSMEDQRQSFLQEDDGQGPYKRGPGRGKKDMKFHSHYGWIYGV
tara:strand:- start:1468 stop:1788 length:321 start_codon:yes stop_codon:yes gene_type:complete